MTELPLPSTRNLSKLVLSLRRRTALFLCIIIVYCWNLISVVQSASLEESYALARTTRALQGHKAALPLYQELVRRNPGDITAATRIACHPDTIPRHQRLADATTSNGTFEDQQTLTRRLLEWDFTPLGVAKHVFPSTTSRPSSSASAARISSAPLYLQPLRAGTQAPQMPITSALDVCLQLFLLAACVPVSTCKQYLGENVVRILEATGIAFCNRDDGDDGLVVPYCQITPVKCCGSNDDEHSATILYLATDLHPNVLSTTTIDDQSEAVMYIGPDSLALVDHWSSLPRSYPHRNSIDGATGTTKTHRIVDLGTGSGIQALAMAASLQSLAATRTNHHHRRSPGYEIEKPEVVCVDLNPRALRLARLNFAWNGLPVPDLVLGDLRDERGGRLLLDDSSTGSAATGKPWQEWLGRPTILLANPPFLPVPVHDATIAKRHGLFSSGGGSGEDILERVVELASECLCNDGGTLAIVSEFMNPQTTFLSRLQTWWERKRSHHSYGSAARGVFFSNEQAMEVSSYASRRADSQDEFEKWMDHLSNGDITHVSPGLLFIQKVDCNDNNELDPELRVDTYLIPKTTDGSIWTPTNLPARHLTREKLIESDIYHDVPNMQL